MYSYNPYYENYLAHHGIKGMRWGVRRYQNPDGSLTAAGKKRFSNMSDKKLYKTLKKSIRKERASQYGGSNRWMSNNEIGEHGKSMRNEYQKNEKEYRNSKEYKDYMKKWDKLDRDAESGKINMDEYDKKSAELYESRPKKNYRDLSYTIKYGNNGKEYLNGFLNKGGKDLTVARIQDLGFDSKTAEDFTNRLIRNNRELATI